ncbi:MAG TPA: chromate transporter [Clostridiaceae bacterium]|nr:chromate transporter [Clostridiaceae bacterium]
MNKFKQFFEIFITFFKIGSFTFGGGYAMIPLIEREVVYNKGWVSTEDIIDYFAICESIPGAIAINSAALIGYKTAGRKGSIAAVIGVVLPSFIIINIIAAFFTRFQYNPIVQAAFKGIRSAVVGLVGKAAFKIGKSSIKDKIGLIITIITVILVVFFDIHAILAIIGGAAFGLLNHYIRLRNSFAGKTNENTK